MATRRGTRARTLQPPASGAETAPSFPLDELRAEIREALRRQDVHLEWLDRTLAEGKAQGEDEIRLLLRLQEGRSRLDPTRLQRLFGRFPFPEIDRQIEFCDYLNSDLSPTCTLGALREAFRGLASRLRDPETSANSAEPQEDFGGEHGGSRYGQPPGSFDFCPWLGHYLFATYPCWAAQVRVWRGLLSGPRASDHGRETYDYVWHRPLVAIGGISIAEATRLTELRPTVRDVKLRILDLLAQPAPRAEAKSISDRALEIVALAFEPSDLRFLLEIDRRWTGDGGVARPGGVTDILTVVGHTECEATHQLFDFARVSIEPLAPARSWDPGWVNRFEYFGIHNDPATVDWDRIDVVLRKVIDAFEREQDAFWKTFGRRVNAKLADILGGKAEEFYSPHIHTLAAARRLGSSTETEATAATRSKAAAASSPRFEAVAWSPSHGVVVEGDFDLREFVKGVLRTHGLTQTAIAERMDRTTNSVSDMLDTRFKERRGLLFLADVAEAANLRLEIAMVPVPDRRDPG